MADAHSPGLPTDVVLLLDFVNTLDVEKLVDAVPSSDALATWCRARGLMSSGETFSPESFKAAIEAREALGALFAAIVSTQQDGHWPRMKVCAAGACQEAFFDTSKNRSGRWCSMAVCGNRTKLQRFRASPSK